MEHRVILVTGGCGYIGSALIPYLAERENVTLRIVDNFSSGHARSLMNLPSGVRYEFVEGDILDPGLLGLVTQDVDVVIHLAAVVRNPFSFEYSREFEQVNHWGTAHLIEACIEAGVRRLVYVGSTAVYDPAIDLTEDAPTRPVGSFAESLLNAEHAVRAANVRGLSATILRAGVVYGGAPNTRFDEVVNRLTVLAATGRPLTIFGDGEQRRPVVHVRDVCDAVAFSLTNSKTEHQTFNVAESNPSIVEMKDSILNARPDVRVRFTEQDLRTRLSFSVSAQKFRSVGWEPSFTLHDGIRGLLDQFRGFADWRAAGAAEDT